MKTKVEKLAPEPPAFSPVRVEIILESRDEAMDLLVRLALDSTYVKRVKRENIQCDVYKFARFAKSFNDHDRTRESILRQTGMDKEASE